MSTWKQLVLTAGIVVFALPTVSRAEQYFFNNALNQYKYTNLENVLSPSGTVLGPTVTPTIGDRLQGVLWATTDESTAGTLQLSVKPDGAQVTGIFDVTIVGEAPAAGGGLAFVLAPTSQTAPNNPFASKANGGLGLGLPANTMLAIYASPNTNFFENGKPSGGGQLFTDSTRNQIYANATTNNAGAQLLGAFGYGPGYNAATFAASNGLQAGQANIGYWTSAAPGGAVYVNGLFLLQPGLITTVTPIPNPNVPLSPQAYPLASQVGLNNPFDLVGAGSAALNNTKSGVTPYRMDLFHTQSQDPVRIFIGTSVPEPSSILLLGLGGVSMGALRLLRRRLARNHAV